MSIDERTEVRIARAVLIGSLLCSIVLVAVLTLQESPLWAGLLLASIVITCASYFLIGRAVKRPHHLGWAMTIATLNLLLVVPELALRATGFAYASGMRLGLTRSVDFVRFIPDETLFWRMPPWDPGANSLGFPGKEISTRKEPDTYRIMFLGDSCTQQGYPEIVEFFLNSRDAKEPKQFEAVPLALAGYSSHQGRVMAELFGSKLDPDLVVVYFGWNDHWMAYGAVDSEKTVAGTGGRGNTLWTSLYQRSRMLQAVNRISDSVFVPPAAKPLYTARVSADQYRKNLLRIQEILGRDDVPVIFITAPTSHYMRGVPDYLVERQYAPNKPYVVDVHRQYNQIVRDVAAERGSFLLDLEADFAAGDDLDRVFLEDGIHFTRLGLNLVAKRLSDFVERTVLPSARAGYSEKATP